MSEEQFTLFYRGTFSNWKRCRFVVEGDLYSSTEKHMMIGKARLFGDKRVEDLMWGLDDPKSLQSLGRTVNGFDKNVWNVKARDIVYKGCYAKFQQNEDFNALLLSTTGTTLVEASSVDRIWGIGLAETDLRAKDRSQWRGTNWLGEVLTKVREDFIGLVYTTENFGWSNA